MAKIDYEVVAAGGERDTQNAHIITEVIKQGGVKGWKFVAVVSDNQQNYVVFEKPAVERRGAGGAGAGAKL